MSGMSTQARIVDLAVLLLHGWPYDIRSYDEVTPRLAAVGYRVKVPYLRGYGTTRFLSKATGSPPGRRQRSRSNRRLDGRPRIETAIVADSTGEREPPTSSPRCGRNASEAMVSVSGYLIGSQEAGKLPLPPQAELQWWYQYYFATERGGPATTSTAASSPSSSGGRVSEVELDDATFERSAASFDNPDHVAIVIDNYAGGRAGRRRA